MHIAALGIVLLAAALPVDLKTSAEPVLAQPMSYEKGVLTPDAHLTVQARCSRARARKSDVTLQWTVTRADAAALRVDITEFSDGFATGKFLTSGVLDPRESTFEFADASPGINYYWRVLVKTQEGWTFAGSGRFDAPICPKDDEEEDEEVER